MSSPQQKTRWGGIADGRFPPPGFFRVGQHDGVFWLIDPDGGRFLSKGINTVRFDQDIIRNTTRVPYAEACQQKYGGKAAWQTAVSKRIAGWGFNTLGSWSDEAVAAAGSVPLAMAPNLDLGMSFARHKNDLAANEPKQDFPDVFDSAFAVHIERRARERCAARSADQDIVGWFVDNELRWGPDWRGPDELLTLFLNLSATTPGRTAAIELLRARHPTFDAFNASWGTSATSWDELKGVTRIGAPFPRQPPHLRNEHSETVANRPIRTAPPSQPIATLFSRCWRSATSP